MRFSERYPQIYLLFLLLLLLSIPLPEEEQRSRDGEIIACYSATSATELDSPFYIYYGTKDDSGPDTDTWWNTEYTGVLSEPPSEAAVIDVSDPVDVWIEPITINPCVYFGVHPGTIEEYRYRMEECGEDAD